MSISPSRLEFGFVVGGGSIRLDLPLHVWDQNGRWTSTGHKALDRALSERGLRLVDGPYNWSYSTPFDGYVTEV